MAACGFTLVSTPVGGIRSVCSSSGRVSSSVVRGGRREGRVFATYGVESTKEDVGPSYPEIASSSPREFEKFQSRRWSDVARDELAALHDGGRSAREAFADGGEMSERVMDRLVDALLKEEGQSSDDYQRRAAYFNIVEMDELARPAKTMQILVDSILAEDGRSATDYNARAQVFAKSAEVFPFNAEVGPN